MRIRLVLVSVLVTACGYEAPGPLSAEAKKAEGYDQQIKLERDGKGNLTTVVEDSPYCTYLDSKRRLWGWIAAGTAVAGAGGAAVSTSIQNQNDYGRATITISFLTMGAIAAFSAYLTNDYGQTAKAHGCISPGVAPTTSATAPVASEASPPTASTGSTAPAPTGSATAPR